jgi:hypothetical protein
MTPTSAKDGRMAEPQPLALSCLSGLKLGQTIILNALVDLDSGVTEGQDALIAMQYT